MAQIYGQLEKAQLEMLASEPANAPLGYVFMDTTEGVVKVKTAAGFVRVQGLTGTAKIITTDSDPSAGSGLAAPIGSLALNQTNGSAYSKNGAADTAWVQLSIPGDALLKTGGTMSGNITFNSGFGSVTSAGLVAGNLINKRVFLTGNSTYTPTTGTRLIYIEMVGGGGGGRGVAAVSASEKSSAGQGGAAGTTIEALLKVNSGDVGTYSIGVGGTAGAATGTDSATAGGNTTFSISGCSLIANGGAKGSTNSVNLSHVNIDGPIPVTTGSSVAGSGVVYSAILANNSVSKASATSFPVGTYVFDTAITFIAVSTSIFGYRHGYTNVISETTCHNANSNRKVLNGVLGAGASGSVNTVLADQQGGAGGTGAIVIYEYA